MTDRPIRASDQERESVVDVLRDAYTDGRLTFDEFEERTAAAYAAKTWTDLGLLTSDLPAQPLIGAGRTARAPGAAGQARSSVRPGAARLVRLDPDLGRRRIAGYRRRAVVRVHRRAGDPDRLWRTLVAAVAARDRRHAGLRRSTVRPISMRADGYYGSADAEGRRVGVLEYPGPAGSANRPERGPAGSRSREAVVDQHDHR